MMGLRRRKKVEGWAVDVGSAEGDYGPLTLRQRLGDNNKLWIASFIVVVLLAGLFMKTSERVIGRPRPMPEPGRAPAAFGDRAASYAQLAEQIRSDKRHNGAVLEARFLTPGRLQIIVSGNISADEIDYVSKMAAEKVRARFGDRCVVQVYMRNLGSDVRSLVSTTRWEPKKFGFVVHYHTSPIKAP
jgi:hypothetical protein